MDCEAPLKSLRGCAEKLSWVNQQSAAQSGEPLERPANQRIAHAAWSTVRFKLNARKVQDQIRRWGPAQRQVSVENLFRSRLLSSRVSVSPARSILACRKLFVLHATGSATVAGRELETSNLRTNPCGRQPK